MKQVKVILLVSKACYPVGGERNAYFARSESVLPEWRKKKYTLCFFCSLWKSVTRMEEKAIDILIDLKASYRPEGTGTYFACSEIQCSAMQCNTIQYIIFFSSF